MTYNLNEPFGKGIEFESEVFTGKVFLNNLVEKDDIFNCAIANVTFEPKCRNNWHTHTKGQILLVLDGEGYFQEIGKPIQILKKGDVVKIHPFVKHWHGASPNSWLSHLSITPNPDNQTDWLEPVTDEVYYSEVKDYE